EPTPVSSLAPSPAPSAPTATTPQVRIIQPMNLRSGPGTHYPIVATAQPGETFPIMGVNAKGDWWQIERAGELLWVYAPFVEAENATGVPVVEAPPTPTPAPPTPTPAGNGGLAPAPAPVGTVVVYETTVRLPTYPFARYQSDARNEVYNWPYKRFDRERFLQEKPQPTEQEYRLLVLENAYLKVTILPELGGRIWQAIHKPSGANMFYQNPVVKPSPWGPAEQLGWLALGGMEWNLPVVEHGYDWGVPWGRIPLQHSKELASVTVFTPQDGRFLNASITVSLYAGAGSFIVEPTITNVSDRPLDFAYWHTAMLAPGPGNKPSGATQFILPGSQMTVHSTGDPRLPGPGEPFSWPVHQGVDFSLLGNWDQWLGFFERPAAHGPFVAVYDHDADAGVVRVYPADVARGSKVFGLGWRNAIGSDNFTDDGSAYVELHGGLAPTFDDLYHLPPGGAVTWREVWYPVQAIGGVTYADEVAALHVQPAEGGLRIGLYPTRPMNGTLILAADVQEVDRVPVKASPAQPFNHLAPIAEVQGPVDIRLTDRAGRTLFSYIYSGPLSR
ncbi:MAG: DUF5107 domain-containing protein, partial [Caldilineae bacterium]